MQSAETVGPGANVGVFQAGFPGVDLMLIDGLDQTTDVNAHIGLNYAFEGLTTASGSSSPRRSASARSC